LELKSKKNTIEVSPLFYRQQLNIDQKLVGQWCAGMKKQFVSILIAILALAQTARATPSGLNNIPTADTPPDRVLVIQQFSTWGDARKPDYGAGFKMGLRPWGQRFEWGLDGHLAPDDAGPALFQVKYAYQPGEKWPTLALGAANIAVTSEDRDDAGQAFKYGVLTHDFRWLRAHAGFGFQQKNNAAFFGLDKTVKLFERDLMLRTDVIQIDDQDQWQGSVGLIYFAHKMLAVESWVSQPFDNGKPSFTLKFNCIIKF
jgi:hypothetical protein